MPNTPPDANRLCLTIRNTLDEIPRLNQAVRAFLQCHAAPPNAVFSANLALEEMVTNIIKYGHADNQPHKIAITLTREPKRLMIRIEDDGREFNPLALAPPDISPSLEKRKIGGLGIHLVRHTVDDIWYQRREDRNLLDIVIRLPA